MQYMQCEEAAAIRRSRDASTCNFFQALKQLFYPVHGEHFTRVDLSGTTSDVLPLLPPAAGKYIDGPSEAVPLRSSPSVTLASRSPAPDPDSRRHISSSCRVTVLRSGHSISDSEL